MRHVVHLLVDLNHHHAGRKRRQRQRLQRRVPFLPLRFLLDAEGRLEDQDCLDEGDEAEGLQDGVRADEWQGGVRGNCVENGGEQGEEAELREVAGAEEEVVGDG